MPGRARKAILPVGLVVVTLFLFIFSNGVSGRSLLQTTITPTAYAYLPYVANEVPPTPTASPTPAPVRFVGTTNLGKAFRFDVRPDFSAVFRYRIEYRVVCPGVTSQGTKEITRPTGWPITNRQFEISVSVGGGEEEVFTGEFNSDFSSAQGTWLQWIVLSGVPICSNTGTWSVTLEP